MINPQIIQIIVNDLLNCPKEAHVVAQKLLMMNFNSTEIFLSFIHLAESAQIKIDKYWKIYLNPDLIE